MNYIFVFTALTISAQVATTHAENGITPHLNYLTVADGRAYFVDHAVNRTWFEAKEFCSSMGMRMAKVENDAQYYALREVYNETIFRGPFWTSGRDSLRRPQFVWDSPEAQSISEDSDWFFSANVDFQFQTCVAYYHLVSHAILAAEKCTDKLQTFCEVDINS